MNATTSAQTVQEQSDMFCVRVYALVHFLCVDLTHVLQPLTYIIHMFANSSAREYLCPLLRALALMSCHICMNALLGRNDELRLRLRGEYYRLTCRLLLRAQETHANERGTDDTEARRVATTAGCSIENGGVILCGCMCDGNLNMLR